jgi:energy-coupling factor transporter ATP-binding protein EcfA2
VDRLGEFQEVVDVKLRHTHPRVVKQRAAAASLAAAVASASASASAAATPASSVDGGEAGGTQQLAAVAAAEAAVAAAGVAGARATSSSRGSAGSRTIQVVQVLASPGGGGESRSSSGGSSGGGQQLLLELDAVSINTPDGGLALVQDLCLKVYAGSSLLIMGPSGAGKTSVLRTLAGLWQSGSGSIFSYGLPGLGDPGAAGGGGAGVLFLPQKPYMVLGSLRDQLLYPTWSQAVGSVAKDGARGSSDGSSSSSSTNGNSTSSTNSNGGSNSSTNGSTNGSSSSGIAEQPAAAAKQVPSDAQLEAVLQQVQLGSLLQRCRAAADAIAAVGSAGSDGGATTSSSSSSSSGSGSSGVATAAPVLDAVSTPHAVAPDAPGTAAAAAAAAAAPTSALDYVADWSGVLSLGEQQRLAFARLLLAAPRLALLDEATSALDTKNEALLYQVRVCVCVAVPRARACSRV